VLRAIDVVRVNMATPVSEPLPDDVRRLLDGQLQDTVAMMDSADTEWREEKAPLPDVKVWSKAVPGSSVRLWRARGTLPASVADTARALLEPGFRSVWDPTFAGIVDLVEFVDGGASAAAVKRKWLINRMWLQGAHGISPRDFVAYQLIEADASSGRRMSIARSVAHPRGPEVAGFVRGELLPGSGWRLEPVPGSPHECVYSHVTYCDLKGWIPVWLINSAMADTYKQSFGQLRKHLPAFFLPAAAATAAPTTTSS
jgi:hypothetical protein